MTAQVCSFTGHRIIPAEKREKLADLLRRAVAYAYNEGCRTFATGGAVGFDTMAAREVVRFRMSHKDVRFLLLLPCPEQAEKWDGFQRAAYENLCAEADEIRYASESYTPDCMKRRNAALAEICDILIAYAERDRSGAAQTVRMAESAGKRVYNLAKEAAENR